MCNKWLTFCLFYVQIYNLFWDNQDEFPVVWGTDPGILLPTGFLEYPVSEIWEQKYANWFQQVD